MGRIYYGWWLVFVFSFIYFFVSGTIYSFTAFFEPLSKEFGWSHTEISIAASIRGLELGLFAPIMGFLVDRLGSRKLLFFGTATMGSGMILYGLTNSLTLFYTASVVFSLGMSTCTGPVAVPAVADWFRKDMGKALGFISAGFGAGGLLVPLTVSLIHSYQWRTTCIIYGIGVWLFGIPLVYTVRQRPQQTGSHADGTTAQEQTVPSDDRDRRITLKDAIRTRAFWHIALSDAIRLMASIALSTHIMPYLSSLNITRSRAAFVATSIPLLSIIGRLVFSWMGDIFSKNHVMALVYFLTGISLLAFAYVQITWLIVPFLILFPLSWGAAPLRDATIRQYFGRVSLGSILGTLAAIGTMARILGPFLAGLTYDVFGSYYFIWMFFAGTFAVAVILMLTIKPFRQHTV